MKKRCIYGDVVLRMLAVGYPIGLVLVADKIGLIFSLRGLTICTTIEQGLSSH